MKSAFKLALIAAVGMVTSPAWAFSIGATDVGELDTLMGQSNSLGSCGQGSSEANEVCWMNSILNTNLTVGDYIKTDDLTYQFVDGSSSVIAFALPDAPQYFLIKNATWRAVFTNVNSLDWAVINTALLNAGFNLPSSSFSISHYGRTGGTSVPEPGALALLGLGLVGLGLARRKKA